MKKQRLALMLASLWLAAGIAHAENLANPSWYILPQAGGLITDSDIDASNGWFGGLKFGKQLTDKWDIQIGGTYGEADEDSASYSSGKYKQTVLSLESMYMFSRGAFRPFVSFGIGAAQDKLNYTAAQGSGLANADVDETSLFGSVGVGFQYAWSNKAFLQADVKYGTSQPDYNSGAVDLPKIANVYAGLGVGLHFGEPAQAVPVAAEAAAPAPISPVAGVNVCEDTGSCKPAEAAPVAAPVAPLQPIRVQVIKQTIRADSLFALNSATLTAKGKKQIDEAVAASGSSYAQMLDRADLQIKLVGHADRTGNAAKNQKLSEHRAEAVKDYMVSKGLKAESISTEGRGSSEPVTEAGACNKLKGKRLAACLAPDRRVDIFATAAGAQVAQ